MSQCTMCKGSGIMPGCIENSEMESFIAAPAAPPSQPTLDPSERARALANELWEMHDFSVESWARRIDAYFSVASGELTLDGASGVQDEEVSSSAPALLSARPDKTARGMNDASSHGQPATGQHDGERDGGRCQQCAVADQLQCVLDAGHDEDCMFAYWPYRAIPATPAEVGIEASPALTAHTFDANSFHQDCSCGWVAAANERMGVPAAKRAWQKHCQEALATQAPQEPK